MQDIHPVIVEGEGHLTLTAVESFSGGNGALTTLGTSADFLLVAGDKTLTVSLIGCRMRNHAADSPVTRLNPKALIQAVACIDEDERPFRLDS